MKSKIVDSNIFLRFLLRDVEHQYIKAKEFFNQIEKGMFVGEVSILVIDEVIWALGKYYHVERKRFVPEVKKILSLRNIKIIESKKDLIFSILDRLSNSKIDFTDFYLSKIAGDKEILSFDKDFLKLYK